MISTFTVVSTISKIEPIKYTPSNLAILKLYLTSNIDKGELLEVTLFGKKAEEHQYLQHHSTVCITGKVTTRSYTSKQTGGLVSMVNLVGNDLSILDANLPVSTPKPSTNPVTFANKADTFETMEDLPF